MAKNKEILNDGHKQEASKEKAHRKQNTTEKLASLKTEQKEASSEPVVAEKIEKVIGPTDDSLVVAAKMIEDTTEMKNRGDDSLPYEEILLQKKYA